MTPGRTSGAGLAVISVSGVAVVATAATGSLNALACSPFTGFLGAGLASPLPKMAFSMPRMGASNASVAKMDSVRVIPKSCHQRKI